MIANRNLEAATEASACDMHDDHGVIAGDALTCRECGMFAQVTVDDGEVICSRCGELMICDACGGAWKLAQS